MEAGCGWLALAGAAHDAVPLPPHCWSGERDPELAPLRLTGIGERLPAPGGRAAMLSNSFAFGGSNCCLIIGKEVH